MSVTILPIHNTSVLGTSDRGKIISMINHEFDAIWQLFCFNLGWKYYIYVSLIMRTTKREYDWISTSPSLSLDK